MVARRIVGKAREDLCLACQPPEGACVQDAGAVPCEGSSIGMRWFEMHALHQDSRFFNGNRAWYGVHSSGFEVHAMQARCNSGYTA